MIKYRVAPQGSDKWTPREWEKFYRKFDQKVDSLPSVFTKLMHKGLENARRVITTKYLSKGGGGKTYTGVKLPTNKGFLHVRTGRLRSSVHYRVKQISGRGFLGGGSVEGIIGTDVWYGRLHEKGGIFSVTRKGTTYNMTVPRRPWLESGIKDKRSLNYMDKLFDKVGIEFKEI